MPFPFIVLAGVGKPEYEQDEQFINLFLEGEEGGGVVRGIVGVEIKLKNCPGMRSRDPPANPPPLLAGTRRSRAT